MRRAFTQTLWRAVLAVAVMFYGPLVLAHAQFSSSEPADGAILENAPHEIVLTFSQAVTPVAVTLLGPEGKPEASAEKPTANGARVVLPISGTLQPGSYVVSYRVLSGDAHPISGGFRFQVVSRIGAEAPAPVDTNEPTVAHAPDNQEDASSVERLEHFVRVLFMGLLLLAVGSVIFRQVIPLPDELASWSRSLLRTTATAGLLVTAAYFAVATSSIAGVDAFGLGVLYVVLQTSIGMSLLLAFLGFLFLSIPVAADRLWTALAASILIVSRVVTGHPASQEPMVLLIPSMAIHVAAAGFWFASLIVLLRLLGKGPLAEVPAILSAFARAAIWSVGALLAAGLLMAFIHLGTVEALLTTDYGKTVLWKLAGVIGLLTLALINKVVLTPRLAKSYEPQALKTSIRLEAVLMVVVIAISTLLAATPPSAVAEEPAQSAIPASISVASDTGNFTLKVSFSSQRYDETQPLSLDLFDASGKPITPLETTVSVTIPSRRIESLPLSIEHQAGNHLVVETNFPDADDTRFEALVLVTDFDRERFLFHRGGRLEQ